MIARPPQQPEQPTPSVPLRPGANVLLGSNPLGIWISGPAGGGGSFSHPFTVMVSGNMARVSRGIVFANIGLEPVIGKVPIGGDKTKRQPSLELNPSRVDKLDQSWVCVEVTPDEDGKLDPKKPPVVVQRAEPMVLRGPTARFPLALLFYKKGRAQVFQIAMFHLRYETVLPADNARKHFFL